MLYWLNDNSQSECSVFPAMLPLLAVEVRPRQQKTGLRSSLSRGESFLTAQLTLHSQHKVNTAGCILGSDFRQASCRSWRQPDTLIGVGFVFLSFSFLFLFVWFFLVSALYLVSWRMLCKVLASWGIGGCQAVCWPFLTHGYSTDPERQDTTIPDDLREFTLFPVNVIWNNCTEPYLIVSLFASSSVSYSYFTLSIMPLDKQPNNLVNY